MIGQVAIVLHAHLPFVRHPEHRFHLEETWLYEAIVETYLPLLEVFRGLRKDGIAHAFTMSLSPTLMSMLRDDLLKTRAAHHLDGLLRLGDREIARTRGQGDSRFELLARYYREHFGRLKELYDSIDGDLIGAFAEEENHGSLELITVGATHGFQPVLRDAAAKRAQIQIACEHHQRHVGRWPRGIWLPECGYTEGTDAVLADQGLRYFFVDSHGIANARPRPPLGLFAPVYCPSGVAAFGRDVESSQQVWSADTGYPGDGAYRDFYRDIGFDLPLDEIRDFIHPDGIRLHTGFKYFRVTQRGGSLSDKQPYDPRVARERAADHAGDFLFNRQHQLRYAAERMDRPPLVVCPYDAELYGHWWFEGPHFLDYLARKTACDQDAVRLTTCAAYLEAHTTNAVAQPSPSSWGAGGYSAVWIDGSNDWLYRHVHQAERRMHELARRHEGTVDALLRRALNQAARELLLAQSSDWAFIMKTATAVRYACDRAKSHLARFSRLADEIDRGALDSGWLADLETRDNLFPELDFRAYV